MSDSPSRNLQMTSILRYECLLGHTMIIYGVRNPFVNHCYQSPPTKTRYQNKKEKPYSTGFLILTIGVTTTLCWTGLWKVPETGYSGKSNILNGIATPGHHFYGFEAMVSLSPWAMCFGSADIAYSNLQRALEKVLSCKIIRRHCRMVF